MNTNLRTFFLFLFTLLFLFVYNANSQEMKPPPPVECKTFDMVAGEWVSEPFEMMGKKWTSVVKHKWRHNHQFFDADVVSTAEDNSVYTASGYFTADKDGNIKGWFYDDWGADAILTATGKAEENRITLTAKNNLMTIIREAVVNDNTLNMKWTMTMVGPDGKEITMNGTQVFKKKK